MLPMSGRSTKRREEIRAHQKKVLQKEREKPAPPEHSLFTQSEFMCKPKFRNTVTDVPFEPKFLQLRDDMQVRHTCGPVH